jgi:hypothetical protein
MRHDLLATVSQKEVLNIVSTRDQISQRFKSTLSLMLSVLLISINPMVVMAEKASKSGEGVDFERAKQQGITYFTKKMIPLAVEQFDLAYSTPLGKADFVVIYYRGYLAKQQLKLEKAFKMANLAINLSDKGSKENAQAQQLLDELKGQFNYVDIKPAEQETNRQGRIYLETKRRIINKQKREQFESIRLRFRSIDVKIPTKIYLPYGRYTANNVPFEIKRNSETVPEVSVFLAIKKEAGTSSNNTVLYTGLGITGAAVIGLGAYLLLKPEDQYVDNVKLNFKRIMTEGK